jgi:hypothetical protein
VVGFLGGLCIGTVGRYDYANAMCIYRYVNYATDGT